MKNMFTFWAKRYVVMLMLTLSASFAQAQVPVSTGVEPGSFGPPAISTPVSGDDACLSYSAGIGNTQDFTVSVPGLLGATYTWSVIGGVQLVSTSGANATVRPVIDANGRYNKGRLKVVYSGHTESTVTVTSCPACNGQPSDPVDVKVNIPQSGIAYVDLYQKFEYTNPIIGPECVSKNDSVAYSIKDLVSGNIADAIGIDSYLWTYNGISALIKDEEPSYVSGDSSAYTFQFTENPEGDGTEKITVVVGRCNVGQTPKEKILAPKLPGAELDGGEDCIPLSTTQVTITNTPKTGIKYKWLLGNSNFTFAPGSTNTSSGGITVNIGSQSGVIYVLSTPDPEGSTYCAAGGPVIDTIVINRSLNEEDVAISGPTCVAPGTPEYKLDPNVSASVNWALPDGWSIPAGNEHASTVNITVASNASSGILKVVTQGCPYDTIRLPVNIKPGNPGAIANDGVCLIPGNTDSQEYSIAAVSPAAVNYTWTYPEHWTVDGAANEETIHLIPDGKTPGTITVTANGTNDCNSDQSTLDINYLAAIPDTIVIAPSCLNSGLEDVVTLSIKNPVDGEAYNWQIFASGWEIIGSNSDSSQIQVRTDGIDGTHTVSARAYNDCGPSGYNDTTITIAGLVYDVTTIQFGTSFRLFGVAPDPVGTATYYKWFWNGALYDEGADITGISIPGKPTSGTACVEITSSSGCITRKCSSFGGALRMGALSESTSEKISEEEIVVYPNPASESVKVTFNTTGTHTIQLIDTRGNLILSTESSDVQKEVNVSAVATGLYFMIIQSENGTATKKVQIVR